MVKVELPYNTLYVCQICGNSGTEEAISWCEAIKPWETPDVKIGDLVKIYRNAWVGNRYVGLSERAEVYQVKGLYYAQPNDEMRIDFLRPERQPKPHQLCVHLRRSLGQRQEFVESKPGDIGVTIVWTIFTYAEFLLWREGNRLNLEHAGLIEPS